MDISNLLFNNLQFSAMNKKQTIKPDIPKTSFKSQYESYKDKYASKDNSVKNENVSNQDSNKKVDPKQKTVENSNVVKVKSQDKDKDSSKSLKSKEDITKEFIEELAEKLNVSIEDITAALEQLNIDVFALLDTKNMNNFVQKLLDIDNPIDLLTSPNFQEVYQDISDTLQKYKNDISEIIKSQIPLSNDLIEVNTEIKDVTQNMTERSNPINATNASVINKEVVEDVAQISEESKEKDIPIVEIKTDNKNNNSSGKFEDGRRQNDTNPQTVANPQNYNYVNAYNTANIQQQQIVNEIVSNTVSALNPETSKDVHQIINQIVEKIKVDIKPDISEMKLILKPDNLGELSLKITTENNIVTAQFIAESQQVKEVLQSNFNNLKDTLQQLGLLVDELSVSVGQQNSEARQQFNQGKEKSKRRIEQIINGIDPLDDVDIVYDKDYINPYEISDTQVDYMV